MSELTTLAAEQATGRALRCSVDGCGKTRVCRGWCQMHYLRWKKHGDPGPAQSLLRSPDSLCDVDGCDRPSRSRGWCMVHYMRWWSHGDPLVVKSAGPGADNYNWHGDDVTYGGMHQRLRREQGSAKDLACTHCGAEAAHWAYDYADPDERCEGATGLVYSVDPAHYVPMCSSCHRRFDNEHAKVGGRRE